MKTKSILYSVFVMLILISLPLSAQKIDIQKKLESKAIERANQKVDEGIDAGLDAVEQGVKDAATEEGEEEKSEEKTENQPDAERNEEDQTEDTDAPKTKENGTPTLAAYSKYDFIPGQKVIFFDDFSQDAVGDFPALWNTDASGEVMNVNLYPGNWFTLMNRGSYLPIAPTNLGENFTLEFDVIPTKGTEDASSCDFVLTLYSDPNNDFTNLVPGDGGIHITFSTESHGYNNYLGNDSYNADNSFVTLQGSSEKVSFVMGKKYHIAAWVQKRRVRIYINETKIFDLPTGLPSGLICNHFRFFTWDRPGEPMVSNVRVAAGAPDTRNKLLTEGRLVTYGIYFDSGSDVIKPESYGTLKSIADVLAQNPDVRIKIIGHTDADGDAAKNLDLSKRRAVSVKNELGKTFGINASRIETDGKGLTQPVAPNDTPANKAQNRRVELVKL
jgi:OmpA-OmpF porin, OOP family